MIYLDCDVTLIVFARLIRSPRCPIAAIGRRLRRVAEPHPERARRHDIATDREALRRRG